MPEAPRQPSLFAVTDAPPDAAPPIVQPAGDGFWLMPRDAQITLAQVAEAGGAIRLTCAACRRTRQWRPAQLPGVDPDTPMTVIARRAVCGDPACRARRGVLTVLRPTPPRRRPGHVTARDLARIRALAEQVTPAFRPPVLDDLDAPLRVGAFMPGDERYAGGYVVGAWAGRVLVGWGIPRSAKNLRRKAGR
ncbi:hypothetical protein [uncultured Phenylobacterium sp.]|uniref:hypothetical protein n=1 Tax=uncultured Phenylobacterium sp. TaxID=349273 RepID=UPI0025F8A46A|nr:hypothetical protein [uncultured Phenylobacterium sp.]